MNWQNLRSLNNSQNSAFEELCCQLAAFEPAPVSSKFVRKGAPDAGVECYWVLPNGDKWVWQAKFFLSSPGTAQWTQIDESVRTALKKHQRVTSFTICLPIDRPDPLIEEQGWFMDQWNAHTEKWKVWAQEGGLSVEFNYWGAHEIWERISREEHRGRYFFWFHEELFSQTWFRHRAEESIANAGPRYSPELNVDLPIAKLFDGLGRTRAFFDRLMHFYTKIKSEHRKIRVDSQNESLRTESLLLDESVGAILPILWVADDEATRTIDLEPIRKLSSQISRTAWSTRERLEQLSKEPKEQITAEGDLPESEGKPDYSYQRHLLYQLTGYASELSEFSASSESLLANIPALLLVGNAGTGKSHLFCDVANRRVKDGLPTVLLLGEQFGDDEPWSQIVKMLGLTCNREELLGALEAAAQVSGTRALIIVDALNEGEGKTLWHKHLAGILATLSHYSWLSIAVSVRSSYEEVVIPKALVPEKLVRAEHVGFADHEFEATESFFNHYGIKAPSVPLLNPEFQNPLFLKVFCKGLQNLSLTEVPVGLQGITAIFDFFIDSVNEKLSRPDHLDFDAGSSS